MSTKKVYHYVYRITNIELNKHYYGRRTSKKLPKDDLGVSYFSSSKDKDFKKDQKIHPEHYKYKVVFIVESFEKSLELEIKLHKKFKVSGNSAFYNKAEQTSTKFTTAGVSGKNNPMYGRKHTEEAKQIMSKARKARVYTKAQKEALSKRFSGEGNINYGKKASPETLRKLSEANKGINSPTAKLANIYCYYTNKVIAEKVVIGEWAKINNYDGSSLRKTARSNKELPSTKDNKRHHKGIYATYI